MISLGLRLITSQVGCFSTFCSLSSLEKIGVSRMPRRIHRPTPTRIRLRKNGTRQPQVRNWSPESAEKPRNARLARNNPHGTPNCGHEATNPRWCAVRVHSMASSTEPPHSPPTPTPWMKRSTVRITAPQMPMVS